MHYVLSLDCSRSDNYRVAHCCPPRRRDFAADPLVSTEPARFAERMRLSPPPRNAEIDVEIIRRKNLGVGEERVWECSGRLVVTSGALVTSGVRVRFLQRFLKAPRLRAINSRESVIERLSLSLSLSRGSHTLTRRLYRRRVRHLSRDSPSYTSVLSSTSAPQVRARKKFVKSLAPRARTFKQSDKRVLEPLVEDPRRA